MRLLPTTAVTMVPVSRSAGDLPQSELLLNGLDLRSGKALQVQRADAMPASLIVAMLGMAGNPGVESKPIPADARVVIPVDTLKRLNMDAAQLGARQVLRYQKASVSKVIAGWELPTCQRIAIRYNVGDAKYSRKLDYCLAVIRKCVALEATCVAA